MDGLAAQFNGMSLSNGAGPGGVQQQQFVRFLSAPLCAVRESSVSQLNELLFHCERVHAVAAWYQSKCSQQMGRGTKEARVGIFENRILFHYSWKTFALSGVWEVKCVE